MSIFVHLLTVSVFLSLVSIKILVNFYTDDKIRSSLLGKLVMIMLLWSVSSLGDILILFMPIPAVPCYLIAIFTYFLYLIHLNAILACAVEVTRLRLNSLANVPVNTACKSFKNEFISIMSHSLLLMIIVLIIDHVNNDESSIWKPNLGVDTCYFGVQSNNFPILLYHILPGFAILTATLMHLCIILDEKPPERNILLPQINIINNIDANNSNGVLGDGLNANSRDLVANIYNKFTDDPNYM